jgi:hypothetical protein
VADGPKKAGRPRRKQAPTFQLPAGWELVDDPVDFWTQEVTLLATARQEAFDAGDFRETATLATKLHKARTALEQARIAGEGDGDMSDEDALQLILDSIPKFTSAQRKKLRKAIDEAEGR